MTVCSQPALAQLLRIPQWVLRENRGAEGGGHRLGRSGGRRAGEPAAPETRELSKLPPRTRTARARELREGPAALGLLKTRVFLSRTPARHPGRRRAFGIRTPATHLLLHVGIAEGHGQSEGRPVGSWPELRMKEEAKKMEEENPFSFVFDKVLITPLIFSYFI
jgi:hypothetical protein